MRSKNSVPIYSFEVSSNSAKIILAFGDITIFCHDIPRLGELAEGIGRTKSFYFEELDLIAFYFGSDMVMPVSVSKNPIANCS